jgi:hypothetical protein
MSGPSLQTRTKIYILKFEVCYLILIARLQLTNRITKICVAPLKEDHVLQLCTSLFIVPVSFLPLCVCLSEDEQRCHFSSLDLCPIT